MESPLSEDVPKQFGKFHFVTNSILYKNTYDVFEIKLKDYKMLFIKSNKLGIDEFDKLVKYFSIFQNIKQLSSRASKFVHRCKFRYLTK